MTNTEIDFVASLLSQLRDERNRHEYECTRLRELLEAAEHKEATAAGMLSVVQRELKEAKKMLSESCKVYNWLPRYDLSTAKSCRDSIANLQARAEKFISDYDIVFTPDGDVRWKKEER